MNDSIVDNFVCQKKIFNTEKFTIGDVIKISFSDDSILDSTSQFAFVVGINEDFLLIAIPDCKLGFKTTKLSVSDLNSVSDISFLNDKSVIADGSDN